MKTLVFLATSLVFLFVAIALTPPIFAYEMAIAVMAPIVGVITLALLKYQLLEQPVIQKKWLGFSFLLGVVYGSFKLLLKLMVFDHSVETADVTISKFLEVLFLICILLPLLEEFIFRGILFDDLERKVGVIFSVLITSVIFILLHLKNFQQGQWLSSVLAMLPGVAIYSYLRIKTGNFVSSFIAHVTHNTFTFCFIAFFYVHL